MKIAVVILNFNGLAQTLECLASLRRIDAKDFNIEKIVVDNFSSDGSVEALSNLKDIILIENQENLGFCGGNNIGVKKALERKADYIFILNNDTLVEKNCLKELAHAAEKGHIISPKIYFAPGYEFHKKYKKNDLGKVIWYAGAQIDWQNILGKHLGVDEVDRGQFKIQKSTDFATGAAMFVKREVFEKIGLFDEKYFLYLEDMDFCLRAKKANFKIIFTPKAIVWHKNAQSSQGSGSSLQDYFITRNRLLFATKYAKFKTKLALFKQVLLDFHSKERRLALFDYMRGKFGKGSYLK